MIKCEIDKEFKSLKCAGVDLQTKGTMVELMTEFATIIKYFEKKHGKTAIAKFIVEVLDADDLVNKILED